MIEIFAGTTIGKRHQQQDCFVVDNIVPEIMPDEFFGYYEKYDAGPVLVGVFDGLGGEEGGNIASCRAAKLLYTEFYKCYNEKVETEFDELLINTTDKIHKTITEEFYNAGLKGGTTLTAAVIFEDKLYFINVGDSPAFRCQRKTDNIEEISVRHNCGYDRNMLQHCIGTCDPTEQISEVANVITLPFEKGDAIVLCSDGITNTISEGKLLRAAYSRDILKKGRKLVKKAGEAEKADNSTIVIVRKS